MPMPIYWVSAALAFLLVATCAFLLLSVWRHRRIERLLQREAEEARAFVRQLASLHEVRNVLVHESTLPGLYRSAVEQGVTRLGFERLGLFLHDKESQQLRGAFGVDSQGRICDESDLTIALGPEGIFGAQSTPFPRLVTYKDIDLWEVVHDESGRPVRHRVGRGENYLAALSDGAEVLGYLATDNLRTGGPLSSIQRNLFEIYASILGQLLSRLQGEERAAAFNRRLTVLQGLGNRLLGATTLDDLTRQAVEMGRELLGLDRMALFLYNGKSDEMVHTYGTDEHGRTTDERGNVDSGAIFLRSKDPANAVRDRVHYVLGSNEPLNMAGGPTLGHGQNLLAPLWNGEEAVGCIAADNLLTARPLDETDGEILALYATQLGHLITRKRAEENSRRFARRLESLHNVANELVKAQNFDDLCRRAIELGREVLAFDRLGLWFYDEKTGMAQGAFGTDKTGRLCDERSVRREPRAGTVGAKIVHEKARHLLEQDVPLFASWKDEPMGVGARAVAALWDGEKVIGWVSTDNLVRHEPITESDAQFLALYAATLGHLLTRGRAEDEASRFNDRLTALHETGNALVKEAGFDDLCRAAVEMGRSRLGFERLGLWFYGAKGDTIYGAFGTDENGHLRDERHVRNLPLPDTAGVKAMRRQRPYVFDPDVMLYGPRPDSPVGRGGKASAALWDGSEVIGFISTDNLLSGRPLTEIDARFLSLYAATLGHLLTRKRNEEENEKLESQVRQAQKLESLGVLAGGIAHDFNNLLMGILGNADLALIDLSAVSPAREYIEEIQTASKRAAELCHQMLAYSGKGRFVIQALDIGQVVEEMGHLLRVSISKNVILRYKFVPHLPRVEGDPTQVRQIVMNLITNASEAIGERSGAIMISTGLQHCDTAYLRETSLGQNLPEGAYVYVEVSDNGCGMNRETLEKIFEPFFTTKFTGRGLGLAAVLGIVRGHSGTMRICSEPGEGTTFKVLFPARNPAAPQPQDRPALAAVPSRRAVGTILVVDDDKTVRDVASRMLQRMGYEVIAACDGIEGVDLFRRHAQTIDCVILDLTMPRMNGEAALAEIRAIRPGVPVVMASGYNEQEVAGRFTGQVAPSFLQKPFQSADLAHKIQEALQQASPERNSPEGAQGQSPG